VKIYLSVMTLISIGLIILIKDESFKIKLIFLVCVVFWPISIPASMLWTFFDLRREKLRMKELTVLKLPTVL
jgi:hypothetical protein